MLSLKYKIQKQNAAASLRQKQNPIQILPIDTFKYKRYVGYMY